jgi:glycosyltransferase involved in cell wall biosynthesis
LPVLEKVIKHGENGLIMPIGDVDALKESILLLSNDPELSRKIGHNARSYVEEHHGFQVWQARLVEFYKSLMPQQKTSRLRK